MRRKCIWLAMATCGLLLSFGCGVEEEGPAGGAPWGGKADDIDDGDVFSLVTYNAGLAHGAVALAEERLPHVVEALSKVRADVVCLQEVWTDEDAREVASALSGTYPYFFRETTEDTSPKKVKCGLWSTLMLDRCVKNECTKKGISAEACVQSACKERYDALDDSCKLCLAGNTTSAWRCAFLGAQEYTSKGRNGLLLLSRHPLEQVQYTSFDTALVKRGMISATVAGTAVSVHCTHLTADLATVPYPAQRAVTSWAEEQAQQLQLLADAAAGDGCDIVLGDLNTGPQSAALTGELPDHFAKLADNGLAEPWPERVCTWCEDNPLGSGEHELQLDHILLDSACAGEARYQRILDQPLSLAVDGEQLDTRLSDHYGLRLDLVRPAGE